MKAALVSIVALAGACAHAPVRPLATTRLASGSYHSVAIRVRDHGDAALTGWRVTIFDRDLTHDNAGPLVVFISNG